MLPKPYQKRSFLRFDVGIDLPKLRREFDGIEAQAWASSYWGSIHCSIGMLLLRGGETGTEQDFFCEQVKDQAILDSLPLIRSLISEAGPFGEAKYAFLFKMKAKGVTLRHQDVMPAWFERYRIHIPIYTNPDAYLIADGYSQHFAHGYAWTFNNQADHGVVNGDQERVHLIFDAPFSDKMAAQIDAAKYFKGEQRAEHLAAITQKKRAVISYPGDEMIRQGIATMRRQGANAEKIAQFINSKGIPPRAYGELHWTAKMVRDFE